MRGPYEGVVFGVPVAAIVMFALFFGSGPSILLTLLAGFGMWYYLLEPEGSFAVAQQRELIRVLSFFTASFAAIFSIAWLHRTQRRLEALAQERGFVQTVLQEREEDFRALADNIPQLAWMANSKGQVFWYNKQWFEYTGTTLEEVKGWGWKKVHHPDHVDRVTEKLSRCYKTGEVWEDTFPLRGKDGDYRWFLSRALPIRDFKGKVARWFGTSTDITQQRRVEEALRESRELLTLALEAGAVGFYDVDVTTETVRFDAQARKIIGLAEETMSRSLARQAIYGEDRDRVIQAATRAQDPVLREPFFSEHRYVHRDGTLRWVAMRGRVTFDESRNPPVPVRFLGVVQDVTDRKQAEEQIREADRRKDHFLATLAHELRNPLAPIRNGLELIRRSGGNPRLMEQAQSIAERQMDHLVRLVDDLLDISRISRGKIELQKQNLDLADVIESALETSRPVLDRERHHLTVEYREGELLVEGDFVRLAQAISNLLLNAAKYTPPGGEIAVKAKREQGFAVLEVSDSGIGIPEESLPHIFDMFAHVSSVKERKQGGLGIGLYLVKTLVDMHGGSVQAFSRGPGAGSMFKIALPLSQQAVEMETPAAAAENQAVSPNINGARRVLIVDDNRDAAELLALVLQSIGHVTAVANSGPEAIEQARSWNPQIVFLDIGMPGMNGYEVARALRELPQTAKVMLVALTGWGQEEDKRMSREAGFDHHLVKPVDLEKIESLLSKAELS